MVSQALVVGLRGVMIVVAAPCGVVAATVVVLHVVVVAAVTPCGVVVVVAVVAPRDWTAKEEVSRKKN
jgi:hypothetical protein